MAQHPALGLIFHLLLEMRRSGHKRQDMKWKHCGRKLCAMHVSPSTCRHACMCTCTRVGTHTFFEAASTGIFIFFCLPTSSPGSPFLLGRSTLSSETGKGCNSPSIHLPAVRLPHRGAEIPGLSLQGHLMELGLYFWLPLVTWHHWVHVL